MGGVYEECVREDCVREDCVREECVREGCVSEGCVGGADGEGGVDGVDGANADCVGGADGANEDCVDGVGGGCGDCESVNSSDGRSRHQDCASVDLQLHFPIRLERVRAHASVDCVRVASVRVLANAHEDCDHGPTAYDLCH